MEEYLHLVKKSPLFYGTNNDRLYTLLKCCAAEQIAYEDGECIFRISKSVNKVMILLRGRAQVIQENFWGRQELIYHIREGELSSESYSCAKTPVLPVSVITEGACEVLFLNYQRTIIFYSLACEFRTRFIHNMLRLVSGYNVRLENKPEHVCRKTTREKLLSYPPEQAVARGGRDFDTPHNRQELTEYLCVDRSAMSSELSKMRNEGILDFRKNRFVLHDRYDSGRREGT